MAGIDAFRLALLVLQLAGFVFVLFLLVTTLVFNIHRHPVVNALLVALLLHSAIYVPPAFLHFSLVKELPPMNTSTSGLAIFCATQGILLRYIQVVWAAFCLSFNIAMLGLAKRSSAMESMDNFTPRLMRTMASPLQTLLLCGGPFVWALPVAVTPIPYFEQRGPQPLAVYTFLDCHVPDRALDIVSTILIAVPLSLAVLISPFVFIYIARFYRMHRNVMPSSLLELSLATRFAAMASVILAATVIFFVSLAYNFGQPMLSDVAKAWESIMPILQFLVFASQREVLGIWAGVIRSCLGLGNRDSSWSSSSVQYRRYSTEEPEPEARAPVTGTSNLARPAFSGISIDIPGSRLSIPALLRYATPSPVPRSVSPPDKRPETWAHSHSVPEAAHVYPPPASAPPIGSPKWYVYSGPMPAIPPHPCAPAPRPPSRDSGMSLSPGSSPVRARPESIQLVPIQSTSRIRSDSMGRRPVSRYEAREWLARPAPVVPRNAPPPPMR